MSEHDISEVSEVPEGSTEDSGPSSGPTQRFHATGHTAVDRALEELLDILEAPVEEHAMMYQRAHDQLTGVLDAPVNSVPGSRD